MPTRATQTATTTITTVTASQLDGDKGEGSKKNSGPQSSKLDKNKIIYNKKAESEFFVDNSALAGFTGERILYMAIRELIENSLDSCESFSILPSIRISLKLYDPDNDLWILSCEDNGTGINSEKLPVAVCSFLTSAKYMEKQQRGLFGVGLKMVAAFSTKDTDFPIKVWNKSVEEADEYYFELRTDIGTNKPIVLLKKLLKGQDLQIKGSSGFRIQVVLRAKLVPITKNKIYEYVSETSIVNPYASLTFETDDGVFEFNRRTSIMPHPAQEILPHPSDMDLKTLKKAISKFQVQKLTLPKILSSSFQKLSYEKAKDIVASTGLSIKTSTSDFSEHDLIKIVNICKKTKFQNPNTDHLSPIGKDVLTIGMMSEYTIVSSKANDMLPSEKTSVTTTTTTTSSSSSYNPNQKVDSRDNGVDDAVISPNTINQKNNASIDAMPAKIDTSTSPHSHTNFTDSILSESNLVGPVSELLTNNLGETEKPYSVKNSSSNSRSNFSVKVLKPVLTAYTSRTCVINNRPTIVETGLAYGGDIPSFKMYRFANKIPLLYDEGSDVAREVISEVEINKMGITKKQAKEQFSTNKESKKDRVIEVLPLHIFFHICSTKIPYKTAGKESIASEGELKYYMKSCLSELYRKLSTQIRKELKQKEAENKLRLYKHYLPFIVESINESLGIKSPKLNESFSRLIENHLSKKPLGDEQDESSQTELSSSSGSLSSSVDHIGPSTSHSNSSHEVSSFPSRPAPASPLHPASKGNTSDTVTATHNAAALVTNSAKSNTNIPLQNHRSLTKNPISKIKPKLSPRDSTNKVQSAVVVKKNIVDLKSNKHGLATNSSKSIAKKPTIGDLKISDKKDKNNSPVLSTKTKDEHKKISKVSKIVEASKLNHKKNNKKQTEKVSKDAEKQIEQKHNHSNKSLNFDNHEIKTQVTNKNGESNTTTTIGSKKPLVKAKNKTSNKVQKRQIGSSNLKNKLNKKDGNFSQSTQLQSTLDSYNNKRVNKGKKLK